jgi:hypothetical protein
MKSRGFFDVLISIVVSIFVIGVCFIPMWVFLIARSALNPEGFWQKFAVFGIGIWFLGGLQFIGIIIILLYFYYAFLEPKKYHF